MQQNHNKNSIPLIGAWKLIVFEMKMSNGDVFYPYGENAHGSIIYTDTGRFSAQLMNPDRPQFASRDILQGTDEEIKTNYTFFMSYYGHYEFHGDEGFVIHNVEGSLFPNWEGQPQKRFFELSDNKLKLSSLPTMAGGIEIVGSINWERIS